MVGFQIIDTYKAYKIREKKVTTWLKDTAQKFGFKTSAKPIGESHSIRISEIPAAVTLIVSKGESIPGNLHQILRDVISQRKEASLFYRSNLNLKGDEGGGHAHYLSILESALRTFDSNKQSDPIGPSATEVAPGHSSSNVEFNNLFKLLETEDPNAKSRRNSASAVVIPAENSDEEKEESDKEASPGTSLTKPKKVKSGKRKGKFKKPPKAPKAPVKESREEQMLALLTDMMDEEDEEDELYFMIYCFFKDFNYTREYLQERWCDYQEGLLTLSTVSIVTNTAFELLQRSEKELLSQIPPSSGLGDYKSMADLLFMERGLAHVDYDGKAAEFSGDPDGMQDAIYEEADFICLPTYWDLSAWLQNTPPKKVPTLSEFIGTTPDYHPKNSKGKTKRDCQILYEILAECCLLKAFKLDPGFMLPGEDELTIGVVKMLATRRIPIWLVFAARIFCDIRWILETDVSKCHDELVHMGEHVESTLNNYIAFTKDFDMPINKVIYTTVGEVRCWIIEDFAEPRRSDLYRAHGHPTSAVEPFHYLRRHPVLCGLMIFRFSLTMNEIGLKNSNQWGATIASAHLYNAIRREAPEFPQWLDIEALILIHTRQRIFWRDVFPSTPLQYTRCYEFATGVSQMIAQRRAGGTAKILVPKKVFERGIGPVPGVSMEYWERMCFASRTQLYTLPNVEKVLNSIAENEMQHSLEGLRILGTSIPQRLSLPAAEAPLVPLQRERISHFREPVSQSSSNSALANQFQRTRTLTNIQLLDVLCTRISQESYALNFDYISLHERCMLLLKAVYDEFEKEIVERDEALDWGRGDLPVVPHRIFEMLEDHGLRGEVVERLEKVMAPLVKEQGSHEVLRVREFLGAKPIAKTNYKALM